MAIHTTNIYFFGNKVEQFTKIYVSLSQIKTNKKHEEGKKQS